MNRWGDGGLDAFDLIMREIELLRSDIRSLRDLIERELYGTDGWNGLKTACAKNTEFRLNFAKYKLAIIGAFATGLMSLIGLLIRSFLGL